ncbi:hypothetical protein KYC5002_50145 [Archangium violaceum]|uniref:hypothetical protein n=1 Tax=Archangium violaceum TaxID=83451 RepID=UPI002B2EEA73|nr:hypothetical protein KYC5002_50145 [Archangium gephyra]
MDFELLLAHADTHQPVLEQGLPLDAASRQPRPETPHPPTHLYDHGGDPDSLPRQRWGVVVPEGPRGDELLALIEPLYRLRGEQLLEQVASPQASLLFTVSHGLGAPRGGWRSGARSARPQLLRERPTVAEGA